MIEEEKMDELKEKRREKQQKYETYRRTGVWEKKKVMDHDTYVRHLKRGVKNKPTRPAGAKIDVSHLGRQHKNQAIMDKDRQFQLAFDFEGLAQEVHEERQKVYLDRSGFETLRTAGNPAVIHGNKRDKYQDRQQYEARIIKEKKEA